MTPSPTVLSKLRRPRLLVRAARLALSDYSRARDLARLTGQNPTGRPMAILDNLVAQEESLEGSRLAGDVTYRVTKHIEVLVALMAESRLVPRRAL